MNTKQCSGTAGHPSAQSERSSGIIFYHGPSEFDGSRIIAIATGIERPSSNVKTGEMLQTWIIRPEIAPSIAARQGLDQSICGNCPLRGNGEQRSCYVTLNHGPLAVWRRYQQHGYETVDRVGWGWALDRVIRFGSYGDPAAVPAIVWFKLAAQARSWTGYTHHWKLDRTQVLRWLLMASVDSPEEAWEARRRQWRTYRIRLPGEELLPLESVCPATPEAGSKTTCLRCGQCNGSRLLDLRRDYAVVVHGVGKRHYRQLRVLP